MMRFVRYTVCRATMLAALTCAFVAVPVAAADPATARAASTVDTKTLMADARRAVQAGQLIAPAGDNAFEYYVAIRRIDAAHAGANEGIVDLYPLMADATTAALDRGNWNEAARLLMLIEAGVPDSRLAPRLRQRIEAAGVRVPVTTAVAMAPR
jgi:protein TonB